MDQYEKMVFNLAYGLKEWQQNLKKVPSEMEQGLLELIRIASIHNVDFPTDYHSLLNYLQKPLVEWNIPELIEYFEPNAKIFEPYYGLSPDFEEWLERKISIEESEQKQMLEILKYCRQNNLDDEYKAIRLFIINNPVTTFKIIMQFSIQLNDELASLLKGCYEKIILKEKVLICPYCGWTLNQTNGEWQCSKDICRRQSNFINLEELKPIEEQYYRLTKGIQKYILLPGLAELKIKKGLENQGYRVELYPEIDKCDLRIYKDNKVLDVDVKDYEKPWILAGFLNDNLDKYLKDVYIVIPSYRNQLYPRYEERVKSYFNEINPLRERVFMQNNFYKKLKQVMA